MNVRRIAAGSAAAITLAVTLTACQSPFGNKASQPFNDSPRTPGINNTPALIVAMPDGFNNAATKCLVKGIRITVLYHHDSPYGAVSTVADPNCK
jgi:hypothetical protein